MTEYTDLNDILDGDGGSSSYKADPDFDAVKDQAFRAAKDELQSFVERVERLNCEKQEIAGQTKEVFAEAKSRGYDVKALKRLIAIRKLDADALAEQEAVIDMYREVLGV